jgi:DNA-binding LacI/PurR family transcriptional regulator
VLNGKHRQARITAACAQRIRQIASEVGYRPNRAARATATGRFGHIALVMSTGRWSGSISPELLNGLQDELGRTEQHLIVSRVSDPRLTDADYVPRILRDWSCDGLLINYTISPPPRLSELLARHALPAVWLNQKFEADCVYPDDRDAGRRATEYLTKLGHRRIAYVDLALHGTRQVGGIHYSKEDRLAGYLDVIEAAGLMPQLFTGSEAPEGERLAMLKSVLRSEASPTALLVYGHEDGRAVQLAACQAGLELGAELSLVTFGEKQFGEPQLMFANFLLPQAELARQSVRMLMKKISSPSRRFDPVTVPFELQEAGSAGPLPSSRRPTDTQM